MEDSSRPPEGTIALLFTDIEGSTQLATRLGSAWPDVLAEHHELISRAIAAEGGYVDGTEGDAFFATFADAAAAARAAVASLGYVGLEVHRASLRRLAVAPAPSRRRAHTGSAPDQPSRRGADTHRP